MKHPVRKQVDQLTAQDFELSPCWEYVSDEEDKHGQDECTVRPMALEALPSCTHEVFVLAMFVFPNGRARLGFVTLNAGSDIASHQPALFTSGGHLNFFSGAIEPTKSDIANLRQTLTQVSSEPLPIRYSTVLQSESGAPFAGGILNGLYWLANWRTGELRIET
jgi:hypothetical protein